MTPAEAEALVDEKLGATPRAAHSRQVAALMDALASHLGADRELWTVVGLVHDLDYFVIGEAWARHGVLASEWLEGQLPDDALIAIAAHDHRTGIRSDSLLADMLRLADAMAITIEAVGTEVFAVADAFPRLRAMLGQRPYLADMIEAISHRRHLTVEILHTIAASSAAILRFSGPV